MSIVGLSKTVIHEYRKYIKSEDYKKSNGSGMFYFELDGSKNNVAFFNHSHLVVMGNGDIQPWDEYDEVCDVKQIMHFYYDLFLFDKDENEDKWKFNGRLSGNEFGRLVHIPDILDELLSCRKRDMLRKTSDDTDYYEKSIVVSSLSSYAEGFVFHKSLTYDKVEKFYYGASYDVIIFGNDMKNRGIQVSFSMTEKEMRLFVKSVKMFVNGVIKTNNERTQGYYTVKKPYVLQRGVWFEDKEFVDDYVKHQSCFPNYRYKDKMESFIKAYQGNETELVWLTDVENSEMNGYYHVKEKIYGDHWDALGVDSNQKMAFYLKKYLDGIYDYQKYELFEVMKNMSIKEKVRYIMEKEGFHDIEQLYVEIEE